MDNSPIFLLGSERSGTNLLRTRLDRHSRINGPVAPHLLKWLYYNEAYYGDLSKDTNFEKLYNDASSLINIHLSPWEIIVRFEDVVERIDKEDRSVMSLFETLYDINTEMKNKNRWFCKGNHLHKFAWEIKEYFDDSKFIYLVRDPRDVYLSNLKRMYGPKTAIEFCSMWKEEQKKCISLLRNSAFKNNIIMIKYEDLIQRPEETFNKIFKFLGEKFESQIFNNSSEIRESSKSIEWKNLSKDIMTENYKKYKQQLSSKDIKIIEKILDDEMIFLNYGKEFADNNYRINNFNRILSKIQNILRNKFVLDKKNEKEVRKKGQEF